MAEQFCGHCGVQIPDEEVSSGASLGPGGAHRCERHRGATTAVADRPAERSPGDDELLFCSNCQISIPVYDVRSGRARREYGSMLCAPCTKSDPADRAARREAVEAEMRLDMAEDDPVGASRCAVCESLVTRVDLARGRAHKSGGKVVCGTCTQRAPAPVVSRAPHTGATHAGGTGNGASAASLVIVAGLFLVIGGLGAQLFVVPSRPAETAADQGPRVQQLEERLRGLEERLETAARDRERQSEEARRDTRAVVDKLDAVQNSIRTETGAAIAGLRADQGKAAGDLAQRMAKVEGVVEQLAHQTNTLLTTSVTRPPDDVPPPPVTDDPGVTPPVKDDGAAAAGPAERNPEVAEQVKKLLESGDVGERFAAASRLDRLGDASVIPALAKVLRQDKNYLVKRACAHALGTLRAWNAVPVLIEAIEDKEPSVAHAACQALNGVTGQDFGVEWDHSLNERKRRARDARTWWDKNKDAPPAGVSLEPLSE